MKRTRGSDPARPRARATSLDPLLDLGAAAAIADALLSTTRGAIPRMLAYVPRDPNLAAGTARLAAHVRALDLAVAALNAVPNDPRAERAGHVQPDKAALDRVLAAIADVAASAVLTLASTPAYYPEDLRS